MKHAIASLTLGVCLLLPSAGVLLAANPHTSTLFKGTGPGGQPGTTNGITCNDTVGPGPGGSANGNGSPFNPAVTPPYAGNPGNPTNSSNGAVPSVPSNPAAVSQYDVACFQAP
jgi:hypothetical protein